MLMLNRYPSLRVAYIDEREETVNEKSQKFHYSVLLKGGDKYDEVRIAIASLILNSFA